MTVTSSTDLLQSVQPPANDAPLVVDSNVAILGCLTVDGDAIIRGHIEGEIRAAVLFIAEGATVKGTLVANEVVIDGSAIDALIFADRITLRDGSHTTGEIWHNELVLEAGHLFEGKSRRHTNPRSMAPAQVD